MSRPRLFQADTEAGRHLGMFEVPAEAYALAGLSDMLFCEGGNEMTMREREPDWLEACGAVCPRLTLVLAIVVLGIQAVAISLWEIGKAVVKEMRGK